MHAFILAGGFATRLWPLTEKRAKPLLPLAGKPIISYLVEQMPEGTPVTISTNAVFEEGFTKWKQDGGYKHVEILIEDSEQDDHKLGALGAVAQWITQQNIDEDILLMAGDNYCGFLLPDFLSAYRSGISLVAAYDIGDREQAKAFGTIVVKEGSNSIEAFEEKPKDPKSTLVSTGYSLLPATTIPKIIDHAKVHPDNIGGIFERLLSDGYKVDCFAFTEPWFDIGSFRAYLDATAAIVGRKILKDRTATLENTECEGSIVLGPNSHIQNSNLKNVIAFNDCTIHDCVLENCIIDQSSVLTGIDLSGKMLRASTILQK